MPIKNKTSTDIMDGVTQIGVSAFQDCNFLGHVTLPNSVKRFEAYVFSWCASLSEILLPASVEKIGDFAFGAGAKKSFFATYNSSAAKALSKAGYSFKDKDLKNTGDGSRPLKKSSSFQKHSLIAG